MTTIQAAHTCPPGKDSDAARTDWEHTAVHTTMFGQAEAGEGGAQAKAMMKIRAPSLTRSISDDWDDENKLVIVENEDAESPGTPTTPSTPTEANAYKVGPKKRFMAAFKQAQSASNSPKPELATTPTHTPSPGPGSQDSKHSEEEKPAITKKTLNLRSCINRVIDSHVIRQCLLESNEEDNKRECERLEREKRKRSIEQSESDSIRSDPRSQGITTSQKPQDGNHPQSGSSPIESVSQAVPNLINVSTGQETNPLMQMAALASMLPRKEPMQATAEGLKSELPFGHKVAPPNIHPTSVPPSGYVAQHTKVPEAHGPPAAKRPAVASYAALAESPGVMSHPSATVPRHISPSMVGPPGSYGMIARPGSVEHRSKSTEHRLKSQDGRPLSQEHMMHGLPSSTPCDAIQPLFHRPDRGLPPLIHIPREPVLPKPQNPSPSAAHSQSAVHSPAPVHSHDRQQPVIYGKIPLPRTTQPGVYSPTQPVAYSMAGQSGEYITAQPGTFSTTQPGTYNMAQPGTYSMTQPRTYNPTQPGIYSTTQPVTYGTTQPGTYSIAQTGANNLTQPGTYNPTQPGNQSGAYSMAQSGKYSTAAGVMYSMADRPGVVQTMPGQVVPRQEQAYGKEGIRDSSRMVNHATPTRASPHYPGGQPGNPATRTNPYYPGGQPPTRASPHYPGGQPGNTATRTNPHYLGGQQPIRASSHYPGGQPGNAETRASSHYTGGQPPTRASSHYPGGQPGNAATRTNPYYPGGHPGNAAIRASTPYSGGQTGNTAIRASSHYHGGQPGNTVFRTSSYYPGTQPEHTAIRVSPNYMKAENISVKESPHYARAKPENPTIRVSPHYTGVKCDPTVDRKTGIPSTHNHPVTAQYQQLAGIDPRMQSPSIVRGVVPPKSSPPMHPSSVPYHSQGESHYPAAGVSVPGSRPVVPSQARTAYKPQVPGQQHYPQSISRLSPRDTSQKETSPRPLIYHRDYAKSAFQHHQGPQATVTQQPIEQTKDELPLDLSKKPVQPQQPLMQEKPRVRSPEGHKDMDDAPLDLTVKKDSGANNEMVKTSQTWYPARAETRLTPHATPMLAGSPSQPAQPPNTSNTSSNPHIQGLQDSFYKHLQTIQKPFNTFKMLQQPGYQQIPPGMMPQFITHPQTVAEVKPRISVQPTAPPASPHAVKPPQMSPKMQQPPMLDYQLPPKREQPPSKPIVCRAKPYIISKMVMPSAEQTPANIKQGVTPQHASSMRNTTIATSRMRGTQALLGNHPIDDILYLKCNICTSTYGSPHSFRKHFNKVHGFEPSNEHVTVRSISAARGTGGIVKGSPVNTNKGTSGTGMVGISRPSPPGFSISPSHSSQSESPVSMPSPIGSQPSPGQFSQDMKDDESKVGPEGHGQSISSISSRSMQCFHCGQDFPTRDWGVFKRHMRAHEMPQLKCNICRQTFLDENEFRDHNMTYHPIQSFTCQQCGVAFSHPAALSKHTKIVHQELPADSPGIQCLYCPQTFTSSMDLNDHLREHEKALGLPPGGAAQKAGLASVVRRASPDSTNNIDKHEKQTISPTKTDSPSADTRLGGVPIFNLNIPMSGTASVMEPRPTTIEKYKGMSLLDIVREKVEEESRKHLLSTNWERKILTDPGEKMKVKEETIMPEKAEGGLEKEKPTELLNVMGAGRRRSSSTSAGTQSGPSDLFRSVFMEISQKGLLNNPVPRNEKESSTTACEDKVIMPSQLSVDDRVISQQTEVPEKKMKLSGEEAAMTPSGLYEQKVKAKDLSMMNAEQALSCIVEKAVMETLFKANMPFSSEMEQPRMPQQDTLQQTSNVIKEHTISNTGEEHKHTENEEKMESEIQPNTEMSSVPYEMRECSVPEVDTRAAVNVSAQVKQMTDAKEPQAFKGVSEIQHTEIIKENQGIAEAENKASRSLHADSQYDKDSQNVLHIDSGHQDSKQIHTKDCEPDKVECKLLNPDKGEVKKCTDLTGINLETVSRTIDTMIEKMVKYDKPSFSSRNQVVDEPPIRIMDSATVSKMAVSTPNASKSFVGMCTATSYQTEPINSQQSGDHSKGNGDIIQNSAVETDAKKILPTISEIHSQHMKADIQAPSEKVDDQTPSTKADIQTPSTETNVQALSTQTNIYNIQKSPIKVDGQTSSTTTDIQVPSTKPIETSDKMIDVQSPSLKIDNQASSAANPDIQESSTKSDLSESPRSSNIQIPYEKNDICEPPTNKDIQDIPTHTKMQANEKSIEARHASPHGLVKQALTLPTSDHTQVPSAETDESHKYKTQTLLAANPPALEHSDENILCQSIDIHDRVGNESTFQAKSINKQDRVAEKSTVEAKDIKENVVCGEKRETRNGSANCADDCKSNNCTVSDTVEPRGVGIHTAEQGLQIQDKQIVSSDEQITVSETPQPKGCCEIKGNVFDKSQRTIVDTVNKPENIVSNVVIKSQDAEGVPDNKHSIIPKKDPCEGSNDLPKETPCEGSNDLPKEAPCEGSNDIPIKTNCEGSDDLSKDAPFEGSNDFPKEAPCEGSNELPKGSSCEGLSDLTKELPSEGSYDLPSKEVLYEKSKDFPKEATGEGLNDHLKETPCESSNDLKKALCEGSNDMSYTSIPPNKPENSGDLQLLKTKDNSTYSAKEQRPELKSKDHSTCCVTEPTSGDYSCVVEKSLTVEFKCGISGEVVSTPSGDTVVPPSGETVSPASGEAINSGSEDAVSPRSRKDDSPSSGSNAEVGGKLLQVDGACSFSPPILPPSSKPNLPCPKSPPKRTCSEDYDVDKASKKSLCLLTDQELLDTSDQESMFTKCIELQHEKRDPEKNKSNSKKYKQSHNKESCTGNDSNNVPLKLLLPSPLKRASSEDSNCHNVPLSECVLSHTSSEESDSQSGSKRLRLCQVTLEDISHKPEYANVIQHRFVKLD